MAELNFNQQLTLALIGNAVIGGLLAFAVYGFNRFLETFKNQLAKKDEQARNVRLAVAELAKKIAEGIHSICWLCWVAKFSPKELVEENLRSYDKEMHIILSELVGSRVILAALDEDIHTVLSPVADRLYELDVRVANAKALYNTSKIDGIVALGVLHKESVQFDDELLRAVTNLVTSKNPLI